MWLDAPWGTVMPGPVVEPGSYFLPSNPSFHYLSAVQGWPSCFSLLSTFCLFVLQCWVSDLGSSPFSLFVHFQFWSLKLPTYQGKAWTCQRPQPPRVLRLHTCASTLSYFWKHFVTLQDTLHSSCSFPILAIELVISWKRPDLMFEEWDWIPKAGCRVCFVPSGLFQ